MVHLEPWWTWLAQTVYAMLSLWTFLDTPGLRCVVRTREHGFPFLEVQLSGLVVVAQERENSSRLHLHMQSQFINHRAALSCQELIL